MQIYLPHELETELRIWAKENSRTISSVVTEGIGFIISNAEKNVKPVVSPEPIPGESILEEDPELKPMCDRQFCRTRSEGKYRVVTNDGTEEWAGNLCTFHWSKARKEGEVTEIE